MKADDKTRQLHGRLPKVTEAVASLDDALLDYRKASYETNRALNCLVSEIHGFSKHLKTLLSSLPSV